MDGRQTWAKGHVHDQLQSPSVSDTLTMSLVLCPRTTDSLASLIFCGSSALSYVTFLLHNISPLFALFLDHR
jgi:hypothetical protein